MKILLVNLHSSRNAGDDVLTRVTVDLLSRYFPEAKLTLAMNDPDSYSGIGRTVGSFMTFVKRSGESNQGRLIAGGQLGLSLVTALIYRFFCRKVWWWASESQRELMKAYFEADLVISSAGNFLYSSGKYGIAFLFAIYTNVFAWLARKPMYMMPQTIGPLNRKWERWLVRWLVSRMRLVFVRDVLSRDLLQSLGAWHDGCKLVPDIAFKFEGKDDLIWRLESLGGDYELSRPFMGVTLIDWQAQSSRFNKQETYETAVAETIRAFVKKHRGTAILFSQVCGPSLAEDDRVPARRVYKLVDDLRDHVIQVDQVLPSDTLKSAYGLMDIFIGTRLHSNIFAMSEGTPTVMIQYQYKTSGIAHMLALSDWVIDINEVSADLLTEKLFNLWEQKIVIQQQLDHMMESIMQQIEQIGLLIAEDFQAQ